MCPRAFDDVDLEGFGVELERGLEKHLLAKRIHHDLVLVELVFEVGEDEGALDAQLAAFPVQVEALDRGEDQ